MVCASLFQQKLAYMTLSRTLKRMSGLKLFVILTVISPSQLRALQVALVAQFSLAI